MATPYPAGVGEDEDSPLFKTDDFRMWCMKVIPCTKRFVHDWTVCPFAHAGEKAVRRDPRTHTYTGIACPDMKKNGNCIRGDRCPYAHNVFEYWLHPTRYRTQLCNDGPACRRGICFFAHSLDQLRVPACKPYVSPESLARASLDAIQRNPHPLGAQLPGAMGPGGGNMNGQQAALAALSAPSNIFETSSDAFRPPASPHIHIPEQQHAHFHTSQALPRLSTDYGSLPRWSNVDGPAPTRFSLPHSSGAGRFSADSGYVDAGRYSMQSDYYSVSSTPPRMSDVQAGGVPPSVIPVRTSGQTASLGGSGRSSGSSDGGSPVEHWHAAGAGSGSGSSSGRGRSPGAQVGDEELAQSLATLKIAMTQQNVAASTASNHEVVINTLHQILMEAVASHGGPSSGATTTTVDIPMDVVAQYAASLSADALSALRSSAGAMSDRSSSISETPSRLSVEVASVGSPPSQGMSMPGRQTAADEGIMRIGADLVREVS